MKIEHYKEPVTGFLSVEKDLNSIVTQILKNERIKKMLYYTSHDCLKKPNLTEDETLSLFGKQIRIVPKLEVDGEEQVYLIIGFDDFFINVYKLKRGIKETSVILNPIFTEENIKKHIQKN